MPAPPGRPVGTPHAVGPCGIAASSRRFHESPLLARQARPPLRDRAGPGDRASARRDHQDHELRHLRLRSALLRRLHARHEAGRHRRARVHGRGGRGRRREPEAEGRRSRGGSVHHLLRRLRAVPARQLVGLRADEPQEEPRRPDVRPRHGRPVRLHPHHRRLFGRPGGVRARALRRRGAGEDPRGTDGRAGPVSRRHLSHRLAGRGAVRHPAHRHGRRSGAPARSGSSPSAARSCSARPR